jgi:hypothetical protein
LLVCLAYAAYWMALRYGMSHHLFDWLYF